MVIYYYDVTLYTVLGKLMETQKPLSFQNSTLRTEVSYI